MADQASIPIAIVGMSCRFPGGAHNPEQLWDMVAEGRSSWTDVPADRYNWKSFYHPSPEASGAHNSRGGHFVDLDVAEFDPLFFGITSEEAKSIDPQQRLQLMTAYEALENAGIPLESVRGSNTSVYIAIVSRDYDRMIYKDPSDIPKYHLTGCGDATACGRISYTFDFRGPCMTIDTGCSGSMVGLHQACQSLRLGESSMALVGGTNLLLGPDMTIAMSMLHMLNDDGKCYSFDSRGSGYGRAEGVATIVLKRLDDALRDGDPIRAVIRNSGVNQDGKTNGILLPSSESQQSLMRSMYESIHLDPTRVGYVEAHGTGTAAGDAAEINSIRNVFCAGSSRDSPLYVGSVKANIGHAESASGLAGIIKTVMALEKGFIPPVPSVQIMKNNLIIEADHIRIPQKLQPWQSVGVRHASINSFGFGGTNSHVILESAPVHADSCRSNGIPISMGTKDTKVVHGLGSNVEINGTTSMNDVNGINGINGIHETNGSTGEDTLHDRLEKPKLFVLTAKSKKSLELNVKNLKNWISTHDISKSSLHNLSYTLSTRRSMMSWRSSFVASYGDELFRSLGVARATKATSNIRLSFLFTGQGAQWFAMGRELLAASSSFGISIRQADEVLKDLGADWGLLDELRKDELTSRINESMFSQPATTAIQIALVDFMSSIGVEPQAVLGHSSGEIAAAYACGILTQESALEVAYHRSFVSTWCKEKTKTSGCMLAVGVGVSDVSPYISRLQLGAVSIACINSPISTTVSGDEAAIDELKEILDDSSIISRKLKVDTAYHSHHMELVAGEYLSKLRNVKSQQPRSSVRFFSSVTGKEKISGFEASYWVQNLTSTVRFSGALQQLVSSQNESDGGSMTQVLVEVGPHGALQGPIRQSITHINHTKLKVVCLPSLVRGQDARRAILDLTGKLFEQGYKVNLEVANTLDQDLPQTTEVIHDLPSYSWDVDKYWHESRLSRDYRFRSHPYHDLLGLRLVGSTPLEPSWRNILSVDSLPWLHEHIIDNFALFPGSGFLCMAIEAASQISWDRGTLKNKVISNFILRNMVFSKALVIPDSPGKIEAILSLRPSGNATEKDALIWEDFRVVSLSQDGTWNEHCRGTIAIEFESVAINKEEAKLEDDFLFNTAQEDLRRMKNNCSQVIDTTSFYDELRGNGIDYGESFTTIRELCIGDHQAVGTIVIPDIAAGMPSGFLQPHVIHPATFDALMHIALPLYGRHCSLGPVMLTGINQVTISPKIVNSPGGELLVTCDLSPRGSRSCSVEVSGFQTDEELKHVPVLTISGEEFRSIGEGHSDFATLEYVRDMSYETKISDIVGPQTNSLQLIRASKFVEWATKVAGQPMTETGLFHQAARPLRLEVKIPGLLDSLVFVDDESSQTPIGADELEIHVRAHAINQKDVTIAMGRLTSETPMIGECAGVVTAVGSNARVKFNIGDRVCGWGWTPYRSRSRIDYHLAYNLPNSLSFNEGASISYDFQTAYNALVEISKVQQGQTVLIHSAGGGVGMAAIMIAISLGVEVFATVDGDSPSERDLLATMFGIPSSRIFSNRSNIFRKSISRLTNGKGVDVILNSLSGEVISDTWACIAQFGTFVDLSQSKDHLFPKPVDKNITLATIDMATLLKHRPKIIEALFSKVMAMFDSLALKPLPIISMPMAEIVDAFRLAQTRKHTGKIVLTADISTIVQQTPAKPSLMQLDENATYLITGGEQDISPNISRYIASRGAKHIYVLSKHKLNVRQQEAYHEVRLIGADVKTVICDTSVYEELEKVASALKERKLSIGGIVHVASEPSDSLESGFEPQLQGMSALMKAFDSLHLEFFMTVSTLSRLKPQYSQSVGEARMAIQDTIPSTHNTHFMSLMLSSIKYDEICLVLEYSIGGQARLDGCKELIVGLNKKLLSSLPDIVREDPFFTEVLATAHEASTNVVKTSEGGVSDAKSLHEANQLVSVLLAEKLAAFIAMDGDDIDLSIPLADIGLDSIVAIEFKNWIVRNLLAPLQTSEILDAASIRALASLIVKRSTLVDNEIKTRQGAEGNVADIPLPSQETRCTSQTTSAMEPLSQQRIPALPLPDMSSSLQLYLNSIRPFCSDDEYTRTCTVVREFQAPGGLGRKLHERLAKLANDPNIDCWLEDLYNKSCFLNRRVQLVPFSSFFFTHKLSEFQHSQAERAAIISESVFKYQQMLDANQLETQYLNEQPVCTYLNRWLFNAARRPGFKADKMHKFPNNNYLVALSRGRVFKVILRDGVNSVPYSQLKWTFDAILNLTKDSPLSRVGVLTADERNSWAKIREMLSSVDKLNSACLDVIEAASFLICLDDASPSSPSERARHYHFGNGFNRWNDKSLQFPVCKNGISGIIGDHSMLDAGTVFGLNAFVTQAILGYRRDTESSQPDGVTQIIPEEYSLVTNGDLDGHINRVSQDIIKNTSGIEHAFFTMENFGGSSMRSIKCGPKSAFQIIAMLASKEYFGTLEPCWESVSLSNFHKGRVENNQGLLPPVAEFLSAVGNSEIPLEYRRKLFFEAVKSHSNSVTRAVRGRGFDRYLTSLRQVLQEGEGPVALFEDPIYTRTRPRKFMAHTHETGMLEQAYLMRDPEAIWLHYVVEDDSVKWSLSGPIGKTDAFCGALRRSAETIKLLFGFK